MTALDRNAETTKKLKHDRSRSNRANHALDLKIELRATLYRAVVAFAARQSPLDAQDWFFHKATSFDCGK